MAGHGFGVLGAMWLGTAVQLSRAVGKPLSTPELSWPRCRADASAIWYSVVATRTAQFSAQHRHARHDQTCAAQMRLWLTAFAHNSARTVRRVASGIIKSGLERGASRGPPSWTARVKSAHAVAGVPTLRVAAVTPTRFRGRLWVEFAGVSARNPSRRGAPCHGMRVPVCLNCENHTRRTAEAEKARATILHSDSSVRSAIMPPVGRERVNLQTAA
jgi:hypothetical protein